MASNFDSFREYMVMKKDKLQKQFVDRLLSTIFEGVMIYVNGHTEPSAEVLRRMILAHGGRFSNFSNRPTTHIVATNLCGAKIDKLKTQVIVSPAWITESIAAGKRLPQGSYLVYLRDGPGQQQLSFGPKRRRVDGAASAAEASAPPTTAMPWDMEGVEEGAGPEDHRGDDDNNSFAGGSGSEELEASIPDVETHITSVAMAAPEPPPTTTTTTMRGPAQSRTQGGAAQESGRPNKMSSEDNPGFMAQYYRKSRLHYLSTYGNEAKDFARSIYQDGVARDAHATTAGSSQHVKAIVHIDLDAFFVAVALRSRPELVNKPVAVAHSPERGEISSCNYVARQAGVKKGSWLKKARQLCPDLVVVPYEFEQYKAVSHEFFKILGSYTHKIEALSIDEAYLDLTEAVLPRFASEQAAGATQGGTGPMQGEPRTQGEASSASTSDPTTPKGSAAARGTAAARRVPTAEELVAEMRARIQDELGVTASAGIASNKLLARMCTRRAKPDGQYCLASSEVQTFLKDQQVNSLPGVGWSTSAQLRDMSIATCQELQAVHLARLQEVFGEKKGKTLYEASRGIDDREFKMNEVRKSVSVEISWGVRFSQRDQLDTFIHNLSSEVARRMLSYGVRGRSVSLKLRVRKPDAHNPSKFLGHGSCNTFNRSRTLQAFTADAAVIAGKVLEMFGDLKPAVADVRGVGISVHKLDNQEQARILGPRIDHFLQQHHGNDAAPPGDVRAALSTSAAQAPSPTGTSAGVTATPAAGKREGWKKLTSPSQFDPDVLKELPAEIRQEYEAEMQRAATRSGKQPQQLSGKARGKLPIPKHFRRAEPAATTAAARSEAGAAGRQGQRHGQGRQAAGKLDYSVLVALPEDMRREVLRDCLCAICEEAPAVVYCEDCTDYYCTRCDPFLHQARSKSRHTRRPLLGGPPPRGRAPGRGRDRGRGRGQGDDGAAAAEDSGSSGTAGWEGRDGAVACTACLSAAAVLFCVECERALCSACRARLHATEELQQHIGLTLPGAEDGAGGGAAPVAGVDPENAVEVIAIPDSPVAVAAAAAAPQRRVGGVTDTAGLSNASSITGALRRWTAEAEPSDEADEMVLGLLHALLEDKKLDVVADVLRSFRLYAQRAVCGGWRASFNLCLDSAQDEVSRHCSGRLVIPPLEEWG